MSSVETESTFDENFDFESFRFSKPKKYKNGEVMLCKIKNKNKEPVIVQFPKQLIVSEIESKIIELEFTSKSGYSKKIQNYLTKLDTFLIETIAKKSEEWFGKNIPVESIKNMYKSTPENTVKFVLDKCKLVDKTETEIEVSELVKGNVLECISHLKYIVFTKESCFITWEICTARFHKKIKKAPKFAFIEEENSDSEPEEEIIHFF
jgi:hypothetical protein